MGFTTYADLLRNPTIRNIVLLGMFTRVPLWAGNVVVVLHVVEHLGRSYAEAGIVSAVQAVALGLSGPYRGRRLDRLGLRRAVAPSLLVLAVAWSIAPWFGYWPLVVCVAVAGLFTVPSFSIVRTVLIANTPSAQRTSALSIDAVATEMTFMVGPVLGVLAATALPTPTALFICQMASVAGAVLIWVVNPPMRSAIEDADTGEDAVRTRAWLTPGVVVILAISVVASIILLGQDLSAVAALREWDQASSIGWVLALWGAGSAIGGLVYGALKRHPSSAVLLVLLAGSAALVAAAPDRTWFAVLMFLSGLFCAPTVTATADDLSRAVPAGNRGEAMGWHGSAMMLGSAVGAPLVGAAIDHGGWHWGLLSSGLIGLAIALLGLVVRTRRPGPEPEVSGAVQPGAPAAQDADAVAGADLR